MAKPAPVYILGGAQTDFARNWSKEGKHFVAMMREAVLGALEAQRIEPTEIQTAHVGNFAAELSIRRLAGCQPHAMRPRAHQARSRFSPPRPR